MCHDAHHRPADAGHHAIARKERLASRAASASGPALTPRCQLGVVDDKRPVLARSSVFIPGGDGIPNNRRRRGFGHDPFGDPELSLGLCALPDSASALCVPSVREVHDELGLMVLACRWPGRSRSRESPPARHACNDSAARNFRVSLLKTSLRPSSEARMGSRRSDHARSRTC